MERLPKSFLVRSERFRLTIHFRDYRAVIPVAETKNGCPYKTATRNSIGLTIRGQKMDNPRELNDRPHGVSKAPVAQLDRASAF